MATCKASCLDILKESVWLTKIDEKYVEKNLDLFFSRMIEYIPSVSCDMNNVTGISDIVKPCSVKITTITSCINDICINKPPLPTDEFDDANTPITLCIGYRWNWKIQCIWFKRYCQVFYNTLYNKPCSVFLGDDNLNSTNVSRDSRTSCQLVLPFIINKHIQPFGICNPKYQCYLNFVIQILHLILRTIS